MRSDLNPFSLSLDCLMLMIRSAAAPACGWGQCSGPGGAAQLSSLSQPVSREISAAQRHAPRAHSDSRQTANSSSRTHTDMSQRSPRVTKGDKRPAPGSAPPSSDASPPPAAAAAATPRKNLGVRSGGARGAAAAASTSSSKKLSKGETAALRKAGISVKAAKAAGGKDQEKRRRRRARVETFNTSAAAHS